MERVFEIVKGIRNVRKEVGIPRGELLKVSAAAPTEAIQQEIQAGEELLRRMAALGEFEVGVGTPRPEKAISKVVDGIQIHIHVEGLEARVDAWRARQDAELKKLEDQLRAAEKKLANPNFLSKAPPEVVNRLREHRDRLIRSIDR
jgi:valyl-tRNA synthetase